MCGSYPVLISRNNILSTQLQIIELFPRKYSSLYSPSGEIRKHICCIKCLKMLKVLWVGSVILNLI